jgi:hypothetical protein
MSLKIGVNAANILMTFRNLSLPNIVSWGNPAVHVGLHSHFIRARINAHPNRPMKKST